MKYITEEDLRTIYKVTPFTSYKLDTGTRLTPGARQFLQDRHISVYSADGEAMQVGDGVVVGQYNQTALWSASTIRTDRQTAEPLIFSTKNVWRHP